MKKKLLSIIFLVFIISVSCAKSTIEEGWKFWSKAELEKAEKIAENYIDTDEGKHLKGNILQVKAKYSEAIEIYNGISSGYNEYEKVQINKLNIHLFHLKELDKAKALINRIKNKEATIYAASINKSMTLESSGTFTVPMLVSEPLNPFIPIVSAEINGKKQNIAFDTGGNFLVMSKAAAENMGISYDSNLFFTPSSSSTRSLLRSKHTTFLPLTACAKSLSGEQITTLSIEGSLQYFAAAEPRASSASNSCIGQQTIPKALTALSAKRNCIFNSSGVEDPSL